VNTKFFNDFGKDSSTSMAAACLSEVCQAPLPQSDPSKRSRSYSRAEDPREPRSSTREYEPDVTLLGQVPALLVLAGYAVAALLLGAALLRRRDVTA
jgi:hypothetical protein